MSPLRRPLLRTGALALAAGAMIALVGCAASDDAADAGSTGTIAPVIVDINEIDGTTIQVVEGNVIDLTGDDDTYLDWTADIADTSVVEFTPGKDDGSAQFNPGLTALSPGESEVALDNSASGDTVTFTVEVTAKD